MISKMKNRRKFSIHAKLMITGGVLTGLSQIVSLVVVLGVYGCASTLNTTTSSCRALHKDQILSTACVIGTWVGLGLVTIGFLLFLYTKFTKQKKLI